MKKLENLGRKLSKDEQKKIKGGLEEEGVLCWNEHIACTLVVNNAGSYTTYNGYCDAQGTGNNAVCYCNTSYGFYSNLNSVCNAH
jgi:hypothetical protein